MVALEYMQTCVKLVSPNLIKLRNEDADVIKVLSSDGEVIGKLRERYNLLKNGAYRAELEANSFLKVTYWSAGEAPQL